MFSFILIVLLCADDGSENSLLQCPTPLPASPYHKPLSTVILRKGCEMNKIVNLIP
jgi:hypothetical protein